MWENMTTINFKSLYSMGTMFSLILLLLHTQRSLCHFLLSIRYIIFLWYFKFSKHFVLTPQKNIYIYIYLQYARVARYIIHISDWASLATVSTHPGIEGYPFANVFSISDGTVTNSSGTPYFYLTKLELSVEDLQVRFMVLIHMLFVFVLSLLPLHAFGLIYGNEC